MADLVFDVIRPDDMLVARFAFSGFEISSDAVPLLKRLADAPEARLLVTLPAQAVAEQCLSPADVSHTGVDPTLTVIAMLGAPARLAFRIPDSIGTLPLDLAAWLAWDGFEHLLPRRHEDGVHTPLRAPRPEDSAIELPLRLVLSAAPGQRWLADPAPVDAAAGTPLWRSVLAPQVDGTRKEIRAVWTPDLLPGESELNMLVPLTAQNRRELVQLSADDGLLDDERFTEINPEDKALLAPWRDMVAQPMQVQRLALSALGGDLQLDQDFPAFSLPGTLMQRLVGHEHRPAGMIFGLRRWQQLTRLGRDHEVQTAEEGRLFPTQHRAVLLTVSKRRMTRTNNRHDGSAWLVQHKIVIIADPVQRYEQPDWPFRQLVVTSPSTHEFADDGGNTVLTLAMTADDHAGAPQHLSVPSIFVRNGADDAIGSALTAYGAAGKTLDMAGQQLTFARLASADNVATFPTRSLTVHGVADAAAAFGFRPVMQSAVVELQSVAALAGARGPVTLAYAAEFVSGQDPDRFATLFPPIEARLAGASVGGIVSATLPLDSLSLQKGVTIGVDTLLANMPGKLLGFFDLKALLDLGAGGNAPAFTTRREGALHHVRVLWTPSLKRPEIPGAAAPRLALDGEMTLGAPGGSTLSMKGTLHDFTVSVAGVIQVAFRELGFSVATGKAPAVRADGVAIAFLGDLACLARLAEQFTSKAPGSPGGTHVAVTSDAVIASVTAALPSVALGQFTLLNLAFSAELALRFSGPATLTLALSSRQRPFLVSYNGIGGGGSFLLQTDVGGVKLVEVAIEVGAVVELNLVVVQASAQVLIGVFVRAAAGQATGFSGYLRLHGSVSLFALVTVSLDVLLGMTLKGSVATARASVTLSVKLLVFSRSVSFTVERSIDLHTVPDLSGPGGPPRRLFRSAADWSDYCRAFTA